MRILREQGSPIAEDFQGARKGVRILNGEYELMDVIGEGSFGTVYEAKCC